MWWDKAVQALQGVPCAVIGGVAVAKYAPQRETLDLDLVVTVGDGHNAEEVLTANRYSREGDLSVGGTTWRTPEGHWLDILYLSEPWAPVAIEAAQQNRLLGLPVLPLPYLVLLKMAAGRATDFADLTRMLGAANETALGEVRKVAALYLGPEDLADLEQMVTLGKMEWEQAEHHRREGR